MLVRINVGFHAGRIKDIEPVAARQMIADGRASRISYDDEPKTEKPDNKVAKPTKRKR